MTKLLVGVLVFASSIFAVEALEQNRVMMYEVMHNPPIEVIQYDNRVHLGGLTAQSILIDTQFYNGIRLRAPINIRATDQIDALAENLSAAFGANVRISRIQ
jgi:hypothetical protein